MADAKPENVIDLCGRKVLGVKIILFSLSEGILYEVNGETSLERIFPSLLLYSSELNSCYYVKRNRQTYVLR